MKTAPDSRPWWKADIELHLAADGTVSSGKISAQLRPAYVTQENKRVYVYFSDGEHLLKKAIEGEVRPKTLQFRPSVVDKDDDRRLEKLRGDTVLIRCDPAVQAGTLQALRDYLSRDLHLVNQYLAIAGEEEPTALPTAIPGEPRSVNDGQRCGTCTLERVVYRGKIIKFEVNRFWVPSPHVVNLIAVRNPGGGWSLATHVYWDKQMRFAWEADQTFDKVRARQKPINPDGDARYAIYSLGWRNFNSPRNGDKMVPQFASDSELKLYIEMMRFRRTGRPGEQSRLMWPGQFMIHLIITRDDGSVSLTVREFAELCRLTSPEEDSAVLLFDPVRVRRMLLDHEEDLCVPTRDSYHLYFHGAKK